MDVIDVLDPKHRLMSMLRDKASGTYNHSKNVAFLMESLATELDLDSRKLKIAAYFHDIGKTVNPLYFTENQEDANPHDHLDPDMSFKIISSHVGESVQILVNEPQIPYEVLQWISQHHGSSVMRYFFTKSKSTNSSLFRYQCCKPQCVEAALLMITDHLEARSRSLSQSGKLDNATVLIDTIITELIDDSQLDGVSIKLGDLRKIKSALAKEIESQFHKRVDYDEASEDK